MAKMGCYAAVMLSKEAWRRLVQQVEESWIDKVAVVVGFDEESNNQYFVSVEDAGVIAVETTDHYADFRNYNINMFDLVGESSDEGKKEVLTNEREDLIRELIIAICGEARNSSNPITYHEVNKVNELLTKFINETL